MRTLCSIQKIYNIKNIEGADKIQVANVLGWQVVIGKNSFKNDELIVYAEIDSIFPPKEEFSFLKATNYRIKTRKFRNTLSQGIAFKLDILKGLKFESDTRENPIYKFTENQDVTTMLGVKKYEPQIPVQLMGMVKGVFPGWIPKTDETRVQLLQLVLDRYVGRDCYVTEKIDGSSVTYYLKDGEFGVCSRNLDLFETEGNAFWKWARENKVEEKLRACGNNVAIQGEIVGPKIQQGIYKLQDFEFFVFDVFLIDDNRYMTPSERVTLCQSLGVSHVPILGHFLIGDMGVEDILNLADGFSQLNDETLREGIVFKSVCGTHSFKSISNQYLLKSYL